MVSPVFSEHFYTAAFLVREQPGYLSRDPGTMINATAADVGYEGGLVVSLAGGGTATAVATATNAGNGSITAITTSPATVSGNYTARFTDASGDFEVFDTNGELAGIGKQGQAFVGEGLSFMINAGTTAFGVGDSFAVTVAPNAGTYVPYTGAAPAAAILFNRTYVLANSTRKLTFVTRNAEVNAAEVQWDPSVTGAANAAALMATAIEQLLKSGIVFR